MQNRFDDLTKALAEGIPRRQALRRLAGLFGGALLASLGVVGNAWANSCPAGTIACSGGKCCPATATLFNPCCNPFTQPNCFVTLPGCCHGSDCGYLLNGVCAEPKKCPGHDACITC